MHIAEAVMQYIAFVAFACILMLIAYKLGLHTVKSITEYIELNRRNKLLEDEIKQLEEEDYEVRGILH